MWNITATTLLWRCCHALSTAHWAFCGRSKVQCHCKGQCYPVQALRDHFYFRQLQQRIHRGSLPSTPIQFMEILTRLDCGSQQNLKLVYLRMWHLSLPRFGAGCLVNVLSFESSVFRIAFLTSLHKKPSALFHCLQQTLADYSSLWVLLFSVSFPFPECSFTL